MYVLSKSLTINTKLYSLLKQKLPNFTEANWTSHLRKYAGFSEIQEGLSDFLIQGDDVPVFLKLFEIPEERKWTKVYIEVKASVKVNSKFKISMNQFKLVSPVYFPNILLLLL